MEFISNSLERFSRIGERSKKSIINILLSFGAKGITLLTQLLVVPLTINYVDSVHYGIWLTLSSIIAWVGFFDLGLGNGMRNKVAEAIAKKQYVLARQYISTTYFVIGLIVLGMLLFIQVLNYNLNWPGILKVDNSYANELRAVFAILTVFFCINLAVKPFNSLLQADQKPGLASWIGAVGQMLSLLTIFILTRVSDGSLTKLALYYSGIPTIVLLVVSLFAFKWTSYKSYAPQIKFIRMKLVKDLMGIGVQFFIIYLCMIFIFQIINIVISRELGPDSVTEYNLAYKYFGIAYSIIIIIISPFWSAFTDAYHKNDYEWMRKTKTILERIWCCELVVIALMVLIAPWFYNIWIGDSVMIGAELSISMAFFILIQSIGAIYMNLINGFGTIRIQLIVYVLFAVIAWPIMRFSCREFGLLGVLIVPTLAYFAQAIIGKIQIDKLLSKNCTGLWNK